MFTIIFKGLLGYLPSPLEHGTFPCAGMFLLGFHTTLCGRVKNAKVRTLVGV